MSTRTGPRPRGHAQALHRIGGGGTRGNLVCPRVNLYLMPVAVDAYLASGAESSVGRVRTEAEGAGAAREPLRGHRDEPLPAAEARGARGHGRGDIHPDVGRAKR